MLAGDCVSPQRQQALLEHGPAMLAVRRGPPPTVDFAWSMPDYADYYPEAPGGPGCRSRSIEEPVPAGPERGCSGPS